MMTRGAEYDFKQHVKTLLRSYSSISLTVTIANLSCVGLALSQALEDGFADPPQPLSHWIANEVLGSTTIDEYWLGPASNVSLSAHDQPPSVEVKRETFRRAELLAG